MRVWSEMAKIKTGKSHKPRKPTLSPTKISTYLACKLMYKYTYIDKLSRFYYRPKSYHSFGASLHRALESFHKQGGAEAMSPDQLVEQMHQSWTSVGYMSLEDEQTHKEAAAQMMAHYHEEHIVKGARTLFIEKMLRADMGEFVLMGRVDRIDEHPDGHLEVIDYKSGRMSVTEDNVRNDLAMGIYAYLLKSTYPDIPVSASIYCLRSGCVATVEFTEHELSDIEQGVTAIARDIALIDKETIITPEWLENVCPTCDYLRLCARRSGWKLSELMP